MFIVELHHGLLKGDTTAQTQGLSFPIVENDYTIIDNEKTEIRLSDQFCKLDKCPICKIISLVWWSISVHLFI